MGVGLVDVISEQPLSLYVTLCMSSIINSALFKHYRRSIFKQYKSSIFPTQLLSVKRLLTSLKWLTVAMPFLESRERLERETRERDWRERLERKTRERD